MLYIQSHPFDDLSKMVESNWSCVFFWNSDGRIPSKPVHTPVTPDTVGAPPAPPPGLDPDEYMIPTGPDMPGDIPGDPITPGDFVTPGDNPDTPFTPSPGQPPPDNPFPPFPGHSPPSQPDTHTCLENFLTHHLQDHNRHHSFHLLLLQPQFHLFLIPFRH